MRPLCVDLDGTLIRSDVLFESAALLLRRQPWMVFSMAIWLTHGKAHMKREIANRVSLDPALLPYNEDFVEWATAEHERGRTVVLATASDELLAAKIAQHLPIFDAVIGSDGATNQKGSGKLATLQTRYGKEFAYAGNSSADLPIWKGCEEAVVVNASASTTAAARALGTVTREFPGPRVTYGMFRQVVRGRMCQLLLLCSIPPTLLTGNSLWALAGLAVCCIASGALIVRDILNLEAHRQNRRLAQMPIASGVFPISTAFFLGPLLVAFGLLLALYITGRSAG